MFKKVKRSSLHEKYSAHNHDHQLLLLLLFYYYLTIIWPFYIVYACYLSTFCVPIYCLSCAIRISHIRDPICCWRWCRQYPATNASLPKILILYFWNKLGTTKPFPWTTHTHNNITMLAVSFPFDFTRGLLFFASKIKTEKFTVFSENDVDQRRCYYDQAL